MRSNLLALPHKCAVSDITCSNTTGLFPKTSLAELLPLQLLPPSFKEPTFAGGLGEESRFSYFWCWWDNAMLGTHVNPS